MYKITNNLAPEHMVQMFDKSYGSKCYGLRNSEKNFQLPNCKTDHYRKSFAFSGAEIWNSLPANLKEAQSLETFKKQLKKHLHQHE